MVSGKRDTGVGGGVMDTVSGSHRLALLGSALAGRTVTVTEGAPGEPSWTDGRTIFIDGTANPGDQLASVAVQASLLAAGSFDPRLLRRLIRRPALAARFLAVEGRRALSCNRELLPRQVCGLADAGSPVSPQSPAESMALASGAGPVPDAPVAFGVIRVRRLLATRNGGAPADDDRADDRAGHVPRKDSARELAEIDEDLGGDDARDLFSSPVGGGGAAGKLLQRMMSRVRRLRDGGRPGADAPTHRSSGRAPGAGAVTSVASAQSDSTGSGHGTGAGEGRTYPEWDIHRRRYRHDWCTVREVDVAFDADDTVARPDVHALRRPLTRLGIGLDRCHRQLQGDDVDIDAAVEARVEVLAGSTPGEAVYLDNLRRRRDLAVLVLLDVSGSTAEAGTFAETVHAQQRAAAAALTVALHELGDRTALYAFQSQGRASVTLPVIKRFDDAMDVQVMQRLNALRPAGYSRLGAAIRHATSVIVEKAGTKRRLLVVLSDGLAYDHGYERVYGAADARRALAEARRAGVGCLCLTIGAATDAGELRSVFGSAAHASVPKPKQLAGVIGPLLRAALRTADLRRRVA